MHMYMTVKWFQSELECSLLQVTHTLMIFQPKHTHSPCPPDFITQELALNA